MVALFDLLYEFIKRIAGTIYYDKEFIVERLADDGLRLELDEVEPYITRRQADTERRTACRNIRIPKIPPDQHRCVGCRPARILRRGTRCIAKRAVQRRTRRKRHRTCHLVKYRAGSTTSIGR